VDEECSIQVKKRRSTMANLKARNVKKCVSILKSFIDESPALDKEKAILALAQLQNITAGDDTTSPACVVIPRIDGIETLALGCNGRPKVDGSPIFGPVCTSQPKAYG
jgi:hypothetical protein